MDNKDIQQWLREEYRFDTISNKNLPLELKPVYWCPTRLSPILPLLVKNNTVQFKCKPFSIILQQI